jgi:hypothetical protein
MKKLKICFFMLLIMSFGFSVTKLGEYYSVFRPKSPYAAIEGDMSIKTLPEGTRVRLIKDESVAEMLIWSPVRILKLMFTIEPHGNWLVEDEKGNRGYMWDSDLQLLNN